MAIPNGDVDEVMKDPSGHKEALIGLLTEAAAASFRVSYLSEYGVEPPTNLDDGRIGKKPISKTKKGKKK